MAEQDAVIETVSDQLLVLLQHGVYSYREGQDLVIQQRVDHLANLRFEMLKDEGYLDENGRRLVAPTPGAQAEALYQAAVDFIDGIAADPNYSQGGEDRIQYQLPNAIYNLMRKLRVEKKEFPTSPTFSCAKGWASTLGFLRGRAC